MKGNFADIDYITIFMYACFYRYIEAWEEMRKQGVLERFDDIIVACGSGGTAVGMAVGNYLTGCKVKVHAILVAPEMESISQHVKDCFKDLGLKEDDCEEALDIVDGYVGRGYDLTEPEDIKDITEVARASGIFLDPVYTGKAFKGLISELKSNKERFKGNRILFMHTGGLFLFYDGRFNGELQNAFSKLYRKCESSK